MNKSILVIGNGFDLDLGLKTKYSDFAKSNYWPNVDFNLLPITPGEAILDIDPFPNTVYMKDYIETIRKSGDCPLVRVINENGLDYPHLVQRGNGIETILDFSLQEDGKISRMLMRDKVNLKIVPPQEWSRYEEEYNKFLPEAFNIAGLSLQQLFEEKGFEFPSFSWIQT